MPIQRPLPDRIALGLSLGAGALDFGTGLGLVAAPALVLALMGVAPVGAEAETFLRWVGAFVGAVGASYLWAVWRWRASGNPALLRATLELTVIFRLAAGGFSAWALATGRLPLLWVSVPVTDFALAAAQVWLLRRGALGPA